MDKAYLYYHNDDSYYRNLELSLKLDRRQYIWSDTIVATLVIRNRRREMVQLIFPHNHKFRMALTHNEYNHEQTLFEVKRKDIPSTVHIPPKGKIEFRHEFKPAENIGKNPLLGKYYVSGELYLFPRTAWPRLRRYFHIVPEEKALQEKDTWLEVRREHEFEIILNSSSPDTVFKPSYRKGIFGYIKKLIKKKDKQFQHIFQFIAKHGGKHWIKFDEYNPHWGHIYTKIRHTFKVIVEDY
ncbi:hypothetical protein ACFL35_10180 [Candidatus Riflebacteria bacterium]